jgi:hypothetical protein
MAAAAKRQRTSRNAAAAAKAPSPREASAHEAQWIAHLCNTESEFKAFRQPIASKRMRPLVSRLCRVGICPVQCPSIFFNPPAFVAQSILDMLDDDAAGRFEQVCKLWRWRSRVYPGRAFLTVRASNSARAQPAPDQFWCGRTLSRITKWRFVSAGVDTLGTAVLQAVFGRSLDIIQSEKSGLIQLIVSSFPRIRSLELDACDVGRSETALLSELTRLESLTVCAIQDSGRPAWPKSEHSMPNLRSLSIGGLHDLTALQNAPNLTHLRATGLVTCAGLDRLVGLVEAKLALNSTVAFSGVEVAGLDKLRVFSYRGVITQRGIQALSELPNLVDVCLRDYTSDPFGGLIFKYPPRWVRLSVGSSDSFKLPTAWMSTLTSLRELVIDNTIESLEDLQTLTNLEKLSVLWVHGRCQLNAFSELNELDISLGSRVPSGFTASDFLALVKLERLELYGPIDKELLRNIAELKKLKRLRLFFSGVGERLATPGDTRLLSGLPLLTSLECLRVQLL